MTAIEWLEIQVRNFNDRKQTHYDYDQMFIQAKQMEKEQISKAMHHALDEDGHTGEWKMKFVNDYINKLYEL